MLADNDYPDSVVQRAENDSQLWKEVFLFAAEREGETAARLYTLLDALVPDGPEERFDIDRMRLAILAGDALVRTRGYEGDLGRHASKLEQTRKWLTVALTEDSLNARTRAEAGLFVGTIGDRRPGVGLRPDGVPDIDWVTIPEGPFLMGSTDDDRHASGDQKPQREIGLPAFRISRYPVTNAQYRAFFDDGGYSAEWKRAWSDEGWGWKRERDGPKDYPAVFLTPNHPRVGVTWYEAQAFCNWLSEKLGTRIQVPTEEQWEKAALGTDGRIYPWGNTYDAAMVNGGDAGIGSTTAVGLFPAGSSPYGVLDMSGNVWEWCADVLEGWRALRGEAFNNPEWLLRCASRYQRAPDVGLSLIGFRVSSVV